MTIAGRVARNTIANWAGTTTNILVVLVLTPYLLRALGDERFGVYAVAQQMLTYVGLLVVGMQPVVSRFVAKSIAGKDLDALNATLSTIFPFFLGIGLLGAGVCATFGLLAPDFFGVDPAYARESSLLFLALGGNFLLSQLAFIYESVLVGHQRYDLLNCGFILRELSRLGLVVALFTLGWRSLTAFATALLIAYLVELAYAWHIGHRQQLGLKVRPQQASHRIARELMRFGIWNVVIQIGNVVTFATPTLIIAKALGPQQVVFYAVPLMLTNRLRVLVAGLAGTLAPIAASTLVTGDVGRLRALIVKGTHAGATLCLPIGAILLVFCQPLLNLWTGPQYAWSWVVYAILMIGMFGRISQTPTLHVLVGGGQIRGLAYIQMASAAATLLLTVLFVSHTSLGIIGVAVGVTIPLFFSHSLALPWYAARQAGISLWQYYSATHTGPLLAALVGVATALATRATYPPLEWHSLATDSIVSLSASAITAWYVCLDAATRHRIRLTVGLS